MKKTVLEVLTTYAVTLFSTVIMLLVLDSSFNQILNTTSDCALGVGFVLIISDIVSKIYSKKPELKLWQYWMGVVFELLMIFCFANMRFSLTFNQFLYGGIGLIFSTVALFMWDWKVYNIVKLGDEEFELFLWNKFKKKKLGETEKRLFLEKNLRFKVEGDSLQGNLRFDSPIDSVNNSTLQELREQNDVSNETLINTFENYIEILIKGAK